MSARLRFSYADLHQTIAHGVRQIIASDFQFDVILAIGGGGFIPARILRTYVEKPLIAISLPEVSPRRATVRDSLQTSVGGGCK